MFIITKTRMQYISKKIGCMHVLCNNDNIKLINKNKLASSGQNPIILQSSTFALKQKMKRNIEHVFKISAHRIWFFHGHTYASYLQTHEHLQMHFRLHCIPTQLETQHVKFPCDQRNPHLRGNDHKGKP